MIQVPKAGRKKTRNKKRNKKQHTHTHIQSETTKGAPFWGEGAADAGVKGEFNIKWYKKTPRTLG